MRGNLLRNSFLKSVDTYSFFEYHWIQTPMDKLFSFITITAILQKIKPLGDTFCIMEV